jgi:hypothetical protein
MDKADGNPMATQRQAERSGEGRGGSQWGSKQLPLMQKTNLILTMAVLPHISSSHVT